MSTIPNLVFPYCWVCETRFNNQVPPGPANEEQHHLFPQAFGGKDGPVVSLCDTHHTKAHKIAYAVNGKRSFETLLVGESKERSKKLLWIASLIVKAEALTKGDQNKPIKVTLVLDRQQQAQAVRLKTLLGAKTLSEVYELAFQRLWKSY